MFGLLQCVPTGDKGFVIGAYVCECASQFLHVPPEATAAAAGGVNGSSSRVERGWDGLTVEREYWRRAQGLSNTYEEGLECLSCTELCRGWPAACLPLGSPCPMLVDPEFRLPLLVFTAITMLASLGLLALTYRFRQEKMVKASSPGLLYITLVGTLLLYAEVVVGAFMATGVTCMLRPWVRHIGFILTYGGLLFKTWRISIIMRVFKARMFRTHDAQLYRKVALAVIVWALYLLIWTLADPVHITASHDQGLPTCQLKAWNFIAIGGEVVVLLWGAFLCYQARKAPDLYNESRQISYALWNEALWEVFIIIARILLYKHPDSNILFIIRFLRTQFTVTAMLILLYAPKFFLMFRRVREVKGTLTDVYGARRVHRLSLVVNRQGDIRTIYCVPCGPLAYIEHSDDSVGDTLSQEDSRGPPETEYSKAEVDALIDMVSHLKNEKELYKSQIKRLLQLLRSSKKKIGNGLSSSMVPEESDNTDSLLRLSDSPERHISCTPDIPFSERTTTPQGFEDACTQMYQSLVPAPRYSRASTVTTYVSSTPEDTSWNELKDIDALVSGGTLTECPERMSPVASEYGPSSIAGQTSPRRPVSQTTSTCSACKLNSNGISQYALNVLRRKLQQNHVIGINQSLDADEFPRILHSHEHSCNNNLVAQDLIPAVCDSQLEPAACELHEFPPSTTRWRSRSTDSSPHRGVNVDPTNMNFIMYI